MAEGDVEVGATLEVEEEGEKVSLRLNMEGAEETAEETASPLEKLVSEKVSLQVENDFLVSSLAEAKLELAELRTKSDERERERRRSKGVAAANANGGENSLEGVSAADRGEGIASSSGGSRLAGCVVISGASSGVGKTTVASCVSLAIARAGILVQPFKVGPDFLDGKHLEKFAAINSTNASGRASPKRPCVNLDGWLLGGRDQCIDAFHCAIRTKYEGETGEEPIIAVIEGCMGLYDGRDGRTEVGSTAEIAKWLGAPVVLVLDCSAMARSAAAQLRGFQVFDENLRVPATVLNKVFMSGMDAVDEKDPPSKEDLDQLYKSSPHVQWLQEAVGASASILGAIPIWKPMEFPERHLGLKYPSECNNEKPLEVVSEYFLDSEEVLKVARSARVPADDESKRSERVFPEPIGRIAVALDEVFCFYYHDNLLLLQENGAELVYFSPLNDSELPRDVQALYIGGGYPENFAARLEGNQAMREEILAFARCGGIIYAECGGLMYLSKSLEVGEGAGEGAAQQYSMVGVFPFRTRMTKKCHLGYVTVKISRKNGVFPSDAVIRGQFFHFGEVVEERVIGGLHSRTFSREESSDETGFSLAMHNNGGSLPSSYTEMYEVSLEGVTGDLQKPAKEGYSWKNVLASFVHLHFRSNPVLASHFVGVCSLVDVDELSENFLKKLNQIQSSTANEICSTLNPIYNNLKSNSSVGSKNSSLDGTQSLETPNGGSPYHHQRGASWSNMGMGPSPDAAGNGGVLGSVRKGLSFNDMLASDLPSSKSLSQPGSGGLYKGVRPSYSTADLEKFGRKNRTSPESVTGFENVSFITIPGELAICSLSPQATEMVCALGLEERLVAVTDLCDYPISIHQGRHIVSQTKLALRGGHSYHSGNHGHNGHFGDGEPSSFGHPPNAKQIDSKLSEMRGRKESPFRLDVTWLSITRPGTVITQDTCSSCSPDNAGVVTEALAQAGLLDKSTKQPIGCSVLNLKAYILSDVFQHLIEIGSTCGVYENAVQLVTNLRHRLRSVASLVSRAEYQPRVISFEGISPLVLGGHWLPEMKTLAGGSDPLQEPGSPAQRVNWQKVRACAPQVLILTPCSSSPLQTLSEVNILASMPGWWSIPAVHRGEVYIIDHAYFSRPGPRLVDGVELLAHIFHPDLVKLSPRQEASRNILKFTLRNGQRCNPKQLANHFKPMTQ